MELKSGNCQNSSKIQSDIKTADIAKIDTLTHIYMTALFSFLVQTLRSDGGKSDLWSLRSPLSVLTGTFILENMKSLIPEFKLRL